MAPTGDIFDQAPGRMSSIRGKLVDHLGDHVVLSPEGTVLATSTGTESLYPYPPQSLNNSIPVFCRYGGRDTRTLSAEGTRKL